MVPSSYGSDGGIISPSQVSSMTMILSFQNLTVILKGNYFGPCLCRMFRSGLTITNILSGALLAFFWTLWCKEPSANTCTINQCCLNIPQLSPGTRARLTQPCSAMTNCLTVIYPDFCHDASEATQERRAAQGRCRQPLSLSFFIPSSLTRSLSFPISLSCRQPLSFFILLPSLSLSLFTICMIQTGQLGAWAGCLKHVSREHSECCMQPPTPHLSAD